MGNAKKIGIVIIIGIVGFFAIGFGWLALWEYYYSEEYAVWVAEMEQDRRLAEHERLVERAQKEKQQEITEYRSIVDEKGLLKYRPYWTVGDEWDAREKNGQISTSSYCLNLVKKINYGYAQDADPIFREWVQNCLKL